MVLVEVLPDVELGLLDDEELDELGLLDVPELLLDGFVLVLPVLGLVVVVPVLGLVVVLPLLGLLYVPELDELLELVSGVFDDVLLLVVGLRVTLVSRCMVLVSARPVFMRVVSVRPPITVSARAVAGVTPVSSSLFREHAVPASTASDIAAINAFLLPMEPSWYRGQPHGTPPLGAGAHTAGVELPSSRRARRSCLRRARDTS